MKMTKSELKIRELEAALSNNTRETLKVFSTWNGRARTENYQRNDLNNQYSRLLEISKADKKSLNSMFALLERNNIHTTHCPNCGLVQQNGKEISDELLCSICMSQIKNPWQAEDYRLAK